LRVVSRPIILDAEGLFTHSHDSAGREKEIGDSTLGEVRVLLRRLASFAQNTLKKKDFLSRQFSAIRRDNRPNANKGNFDRTNKAFWERGEGPSAVAVA
jgi:hypothetical protein